MALGLAVPCLAATTVAPSFVSGSTTGANGGTVVYSAASGPASLALSTSGGRTPSGCVIPTGTAAGAAGAFKVRGTAKHAWTIAVDSSNATVLSGGASSLSYASVTLSVSAGTFPNGGTPTTSGPYPFGLTFNGIAAGTYSGQFTVLVTYN